MPIAPCRKPGRVGTIALLLTLDLAGTSALAAPALLVREFLAPASHTFGPPSPLVTPEGTHFDLDGDGTPEIVTQLVSGGSVTFSFFAGRDGHLVQSYTTGRGAGGQWLEGVHDLNADGVNDIVIQFSNNPGFSVSVVDPFAGALLLGRSGTFDAVMDVDGDGKQELLLTSSVEPPGVPRVEVWGDGSTAPTAVVDAAPRARGALDLAQNAPNPFNPSTRIVFQVQLPGRVVLSVFDAAGRLVRTLVDEQRAPGDYTADWDGRDGHGAPVASGAYVYQLQVGDFSASRKMLMVR